ncbi:alkane 1-monooxygenase [Amylibacter kogurei]|uniref:Alkane 1-monooxygenase n=1 Tax=Paramylibacter kogurei TaxID=1889778 RepID=A0A2G5K100_9RHOB|nr:alkane 1-monooxygenase [Amylibacter kogurei]PIB23105.1 alkane 1-monooxygenase [Amylibacter kogurei]
MNRPKDISLLRNALPFWITLLTLVLLGVSAYLGGWWLLLVYLNTWILIGALDTFEGLYTANADPQTDDASLFWFRLITIIWFPLEFIAVFACIAAVTFGDYTMWEKIALMGSMGIITGSVGIVYAHELMHQKSKLERHMGDGLMALALYGHFRSEHLLVHHRYVGTPKDPVTARYNEGFHRFFPRVLIGCLRSSWAAEKSMLARKQLLWWHKSNPFWKYATLQGAFLLIAFAIGGLAGVGFFIFQAAIAVWQLELVNYVEHYGLTRKHLGDGKYEHTKPQHSWNAAHKISNYFLLNLQRHSDHHYKPDRRYPLLQNYDDDAAPQLPRSYPIMTFLAMIPPVWKRVMNPRVRAWRAQFYPEITDWHAYNKAENPMPR